MSRDREKMDDRETKTPIRYRVKNLLSLPKEAETFCPGLFLYLTFYSVVALTTG